ncbi:MAG: hypothetical protein ABEK17_03225 [Candidatus Aenigmatarchaeota archaeon]
MFWNKDKKGSEDSEERELKELKEQIESKRSKGEPQEFIEPREPLPAPQPEGPEREDNMRRPEKVQISPQNTQRPKSPRNLQTSGRSQLGQRIPESGELENERIPERSKPDFKAPASAPLFIKIDRYKEVLEQLGEIRKTLKSLKKLLNLLVNIDDLKGNTMSTFKDAIGDVTDSLISLDEQFIRPEGADEIIPEEETKSEVEDYMTDLRSELSELRRELDKIE